MPHIAVSAKTVKIVHNPNSGNSKAWSEQVMNALLDKFGVTYEWITGIELKKLAQQSDEHHTILIVGGDGTINRILNTIGYQNLHKFTFGIIPLGTGNDFARSLDIPLQLDKALDALLHGETETVDLGLLNNRICFTCAISIGFGPEVTKNASRPLRHLIGRGALLVGAFMYLIRPKPNYKIKTVIDKSEIRQIKTPHLVIGNAKYHGGGFPISPKADLRNGKLDLYYFKPVALHRLPKIFLRAFATRNHTIMEEVIYQQIEEIKMALKAPLEVDVDGDIYTFYREVNVKVIPAKLSVLVPQRSQSSLNDELVQNKAWQLVGGKSCAG